MPAQPRAAGPVAGQGHRVRHAGHGTEHPLRLERDFLELCRDAGIRLPRVNVMVAGYEVDAVWPDQQLIVELDSRTFHHTTAAFERDRIRDADLQLAGYRVVRLTHRRLRTEPAGVMQMLRTMLGRT